MAVSDLTVWLRKLDQGRGHGQNHGLVLQLVHLILGLYTMANFTTTIFQTSNSNGCSVWRVTSVRPTPVGLSGMEGWRLGHSTQIVCHLSVSTTHNRSLHRPSRILHPVHHLPLQRQCPLQCPHQCPLQVPVRLVGVGKLSNKSVVSTLVIGMLASIVVWIMNSVFILFVQASMIFTKLVQQVASLCSDPLRYCLPSKKRGYAHLRGVWRVTSVLLEAPRHLHMVFQRCI